MKSVAKGNLFTMNILDFAPKKLNNFILVIFCEYA